jgi:uncharacterized protein (TIGR00297 family)
LSITFALALVDVAVVVAFALSAILVKALDSRGFLASLAVGYSILVGGGPSWFVIVAVFFTLGVGFTWYEYSFKKKIGGAQEKGGARSWPNILANGGIASILAVQEFFLGRPILAALFLGSISTAAADTVATELGLLNTSWPRLITSPRKVVAPGTSGGVTSLGFVGASLASLVIGVMALLLRILPGGFLVMVVCLGGGVSGAVVDSVLGAAVQRKGYCVVCLRPTEALHHCGEKTKRTGGSFFIENNIVNLLATIAGAAVAGAIALALSVA